MKMDTPKCLMYTNMSLLSILKVRGVGSGNLASWQPNIDYFVWHLPGEMDSIPMLCWINLLNSPILSNFNSWAATLEDASACMGYGKLPKNDSSKQMVKPLQVIVKKQWLKGLCLLLREQLHGKLLWKVWQDSTISVASLYFCDIWYLVLYLVCSKPELHTWNWQFLTIGWDVLDGMASGYFVPSTMALLSWDIEDSHIQKITLSEVKSLYTDPIA